MEMVPFANARETDRALPVSGNSMVPHYPPGTIVQIREVENWHEYIETGEDAVYVIVLKDDRRLLKELHKGSDKNTISIHSYNPNVDDAELPKSLVRSIWRVLAKYQKVAL